MWKDSTVLAPQALPLGALGLGPIALPSAVRHVTGPDAYAVLHRRILEISGHAVALDICSRLNSQIVRYRLFSFS